MNAAAAVLAERGGAPPRVGVVLGSGLGAVADAVQDPVVVGYEDLPGFPRPGVAGHAGRAVLGRVGGVQVAVLQGRAHLYEGGDPDALRVPVRALRAAGAEILVLTNAAGSLRPEVGPGSLLAITDHINLTGMNLLVGPNDDATGPRFPALRDAYDPALLAELRAAAGEAGIPLAEGVYLAVTGPSFETPAEIRAYRTLGADAVGMSTVQETILARHCGLRVVGVSLITNLAEGLSDEPLSHEQTLRTAELGAADLTRLLLAFLPASVMNVPELIRKKRDGGELSAEEIWDLVRGISDGTVTDAQVGALAMAIVWRGMGPAERVELTGAMTRSGEVLDWSDAGLHGPVLDKHSTGGVGDKVSLLLAPILAACGAAVPMISGRGLGHTGGTLDKLESIPGYDVAPSPDRLREVIGRVGCAIVGQTERLAPADRRLYAIRDATGTVESIPLIVASILSKKLAEGLDALVMDVKVGSGAWWPELERARELARAIVEVAVGNLLPTTALLTDMNQVLGRAAGNAVEVRESLDHLTGAARDERLLEVTLALAAELLVLGRLHPDVDSARAAALQALRSGAAAERFGAMAAALGGPAGLLEDPDRFLPRAPVVRPAEPVTAGVVRAIDVRAVGIAIVGLGGGRARETDAVDHAVGLTEVAGVGERVGPGERPLALVHARDDDGAERAAEAIRASYVIGDAPREVPGPVLEVQRTV